jgi:hypothetical protein
MLSIPLPSLFSPHRVSQVLRGVRGYLVNREGQDCLEKM